MSDPRTELQLRLGRIAQEGQAFEVTVALVLTQSLQVSLEAGTLTASVLGVSSALRLIEMLSRLPGQRLDLEDVKKWLKQATNANERRNAAIHESWAANAETGEFTRLQPKKLRGGAASLSELDQTAAALHEASSAGIELLPERPAFS